MAYIRKTANGYRAEVERNGVRDSATRETMAAARLWAADREAEILAVKRGGYPKKTFAQAIEKYRDEVSPTKAGGPWEAKRLNALLRDFPKLVALELLDVSKADMASWRDARLRVVSKGSVQRDLNLISNVFTIARNDWGWMGESPLVGFRAPGQNPPRKRIVSWREIRLIVRWLGYRTGCAPVTKQQHAAYAYLIALRTAMRAGEVLQLGPGTVDVAARKATVHHKTEYLTGEPRVVPLTRRALRLIKALGPAGVEISSASLDATFRKATHGCLVKGTTFHDSRANALTRFSKRVDVMTLAKISGHKDLQLLLDTYYRVTPAEIAARLD